MTTAQLLADLEGTARQADAAEGELRAEFARRIAALADERAFAYRRLNLVRRTAEAMSSAEDPDVATAFGIAALCRRLGWDATEGVHGEIAAEFGAVCRAFYLSDKDDPQAADPAEALAAFEVWYLGRIGSPFWVVFENPMPDTPRVDF